ncbi:MAG: hypothetical protein AB7F50_05945 [Fimbriimonadaceae bacterium]
MRTTPIFVLLALTLAGCAPKAAEVAGAGATPKPGEAPAEKSFVVPEELKNDAYVYYGLGNTEEMTYEMVQGKGMAPQEGTQTMRTKSGAKDGKMVFSTVRSGGMSGMGDEELSLEKGGLYLTFGSIISPTEPSLVLPSKLDVGTTWKTDTTMTSNTANTTVKMKGTSKVEKSETIKVKAGTFDTLLIIQTAEADNNGAKGTMSAKGWYAKDVGIVKMNLEYKQADGQIVTTTLELVRKGKGAETSS